MSGHPLIVGGIPLPSDSTLFLALIAIHVLAGLTCVVAGAVAMLSPKLRGRHPSAGGIYYWALAAVAATMAVLAISRWSEDWPLFVLGALSFACATFGRSARRRLWPNWARLHVTGMGVLHSSPDRLLRGQRQEPAALAIAAPSRVLGSSGRDRPAHLGLGASPPPAFAPGKSRPGYACLAASLGGRLRRSL